MIFGANFRYSPYFSDYGYPLVHTHTHTHSLIHKTHTHTHTHFVKDVF